MPSSAWSDGAYYRMLAYGFRVRARRPALDRYLSRVLQPFDLGTSCQAELPLYELCPDQDGGDGPQQYRLSENGDELTRGPASHVLDYLLWHLNAQMVAHTSELLLLHAGAVVIPDAGTAVLVLGPSGAGKSTLVAGLVRAGFGYLSDEVGALEPTTGLVRPFPRALTLKGDSRQLFPGLAPEAEEAALVGEQWHVDPDRLRPNAIGSSAPVGLVVAIEHRAGQATEVTPLTAGQTCLELMENLANLEHLCFAGLPVVAELAPRVPGYRLVSDSLAEAVAAVRRLGASI